MTDLARAELESVLRANREAVATLLDGLTEEEARALLVPSLTTLLGLVKHASYAERVWFHVSLGRQSPEAAGLAASVDDSFRLEPSDSIASVVAAYRRSCSEAEALAAGFPLDHVVEHPRRGRRTLHWVLLHLVEELARHAGHGDILREQVLAARRPDRA